MRRELKTLKAMIRLFCRARHGRRNGLCPSCARLERYGSKRLARCPFQDDKTTCATCSIHCYQPLMKQEMIAVMRYSGPRMVLRHPVLALLHLLDGRKRRPRQNDRSSSAKGGSPP